MSYEVEQKYQLSDSAAFETFSRQVKQSLVRDYTGRIDPVLEETDLYFNHPCRDFRITDEAFRIRFRSYDLDLPVCERQTENFVTYKGPKLDTQTKTRREIELPLPKNASVEQWQILMTALGFVPVGRVNKQRQKIHFIKDGASVELSLDILQRGTSRAEQLYFVEIELIAPTDDDLDFCRKELIQIAESLNLNNIVRKSYLEFVIDP